MTKYSKDLALQILKNMKDEDIDFSDIPELDEEWFRRAEVVMPKNKKAVSIRLDEDVLEWFKAQGDGYQTRINAVLRAFYQMHKDANK